MLKILHTADWHLGYVSQQLDDEDAKRLAQARLAAIEQVFGIAHRQEVRCMLCAGDLFDVPEPPEEWWRGLLDVFHRRHDWTIPVILLPGNHDPIKVGSVYSREHPFRTTLPAWVHVVDSREFSLNLGDDATIYAAPCTSTAGSTDLALALPNRVDGDTRFRVGLVHGSTFDVPDYQVNFPISKDAADLRGLDYLAVGDTHGYREVVPGATAPTIYPGTPEPTKFGEKDAGEVVIVAFRTRGRAPRLFRERVARWTWEDRTVKSMEELDALLDEDLAQTVLRLRLEFMVTVGQRERVDLQLSRLKGTIAVHGRVGAMIVDDSSLQLDLAGTELSEDLPDLFLAAEEILKDASETDPVAERALVLLHRFVQELA